MGDPRKTVGSCWLSVEAFSGLSSETHALLIDALVLFLVEAGGLTVVSVIVLARSGSDITAPLHAAGGAPRGWGSLSAPSTRVDQYSPLMGHDVTPTSS
jgi:hypothetical protein